MNVHRNFVRLAILALAATALSVGTSSAQNFQGKFTLNHQAQWGQVTLQPGSYTLKMTRAQGGQRMVEVRSEANRGNAAIIMPASVDASSTAGSKSDLVCIRQGGTLIVRALEAGPTGETAYFHTPNNETLSAKNHSGHMPALMAQGPTLIQRVEVE